MAVSLQFLGAAETVTGSKYLVSDGKYSILVDCGLFQGNRDWRVKNWDPPPVDPSKLDCVLLTHAHIDHVGMLPRYYKLGLRCPVFVNQATHDLARIILLDSAKLQEEEAAYRSEYKKSRHSPPLPLYTEAEAHATLGLLKTIPKDSEAQVLPGISAAWSAMGHIIGASSITLKIGGKIINFSGDIGRYSVPILRDPAPVTFGDLLLIESTYGDRLHNEIDPSESLANIINRTEKRGGVVVIPSFAVGRTQTLLFYMRELKEKHKIPNIPIIIDSPMADDATEIYKSNPSDYDEDSMEILNKGKHPFSAPKMYFTRDRVESIKLNSIDQPMIIISASGMLTGGRILHHLKHRISSPKNTILFVGFQPPGSRGDYLKQGVKEIRILGDDLPVNAEIAEISGLSAHADRDELLRWCTSCQGKPKKVAVVHGEPESAKAFRQSLVDKFGWDVFVPKYLQTIEV